MFLDLDILNAFHVPSKVRHGGRKGGREREERRAGRGRGRGRKEEKNREVGVPDKIWSK